MNYLFRFALNGVYVLLLSTSAISAMAYNVHTSHAMLCVVPDSLLLLVEVFSGVSPSNRKSTHGILAD